MLFYASLDEGSVSIDTASGQAASIREILRSPQTSRTIGAQESENFFMTLRTQLFGAGLPLLNRNPECGISIGMRERRICFYRHRIRTGCFDSVDPSLRTDPHTNPCSGYRITFL